MATATRKSPSAFLLLFFLILLLNPTPSSSLPFFAYQTLLSLSHSLTSRVANLRAARGDSAGAARAKALAQKLEFLSGLGFWKVSWIMGRYYIRNFDWADLKTFSFSSITSDVSDLNELVRAVKEWTRVDSDADRVAWISRNYNNVLAISKSFLGKLLKAFRDQGPLKEIVEIMWKEVVEGDLLKDCLELGTNDLKGLIQIIREIADLRSELCSSDPLQKQIRPFVSKNQNDRRFEEN